MNKERAGHSRPTGSFAEGRSGRMARQGKPPSRKLSQDSSAESPPPKGDDGPKGKSEGYLVPSDVPQLLGGEFQSLSYEGQQWCDVFSSYRFCLIHGSQILSAVLWGA